MVPKKYVVTLMLCALALLLLNSSCGSRTETADASSGNSVKQADTFTTVMNGNSFDISMDDTFRTDAVTVGGQPNKALGYLPKKINGKTIYTLCDEKVIPKLTADGQQKVNAVSEFLKNRFTANRGKARVSINSFVIDESGKVVLYSGAAIAETGSNMKPDDLHPYWVSAKPVVDSLQPVLLAITFEPAHVNGKAVPYYIPDIQELK